MIQIKNITKIFRSKKSTVYALNDINLNIKKGSFILIKGSSGCGKSTLLFTIAGMLQPTSGNIRFENEDIYQWSVRQQLSYRSRKIGFVYQSYPLIPYLNVLENILLPNHSGEKIIKKEEVTTLAIDLSIFNRLFHKPSELSEGEKQRVALLRALMIHPQLLLADEPTGNLDPENSAIIMKYFEAYRSKGGTVVMATHGNEADKLADMIIYLKEGKVHHIERKTENVLTK